MAVQLYDERKYTVAKICGLMGESRSTLCNYINAAKKQDATCITTNYY
ncbi:helix-turn-helix domain-containing protein [Klebsiella variicola]